MSNIHLKENESNSPNFQDATYQLKALETILHNPSFDLSNADFEAMVACDFREVGASGVKYSRSEVINVLEVRLKNKTMQPYVLTEFECQELAPTVFLVTYLLDQSGRLSRRASIWYWDCGHWLIRYHQGTLV